MRATLALLLLVACDIPAEIGGTFAVSIPEEQRSAFGLRSLTVTSDGALFLEPLEGAQVDAHFSAGEVRAAGGGLTQGAAADVVARELLVVMMQKSVHPQDAFDETVAQKIHSFFFEPDPDGGVKASALASGSQATTSLPVSSASGPPSSAVRAAPPPSDCYDASFEGVANARRHCQCLVDHGSTIDLAFCVASRERSEVWLAERHQSVGDERRMIGYCQDQLAAAMVDACTVQTVFAKMPGDVWCSPDVFVSFWKTQVYRDDGLCWPDSGRRCIDNDCTRRLMACKEQGAARFPCE